MQSWTEANFTKNDCKDTHSGSGTSCDHIISGQSGIVPQSSGTLTHARFGGAVLFVDHFSNFVYVHLISSPTAEATLAAKHAYERIARTHGVTIKRYRGDNSRFDEKGFQDDCHRQHQEFSYCGVGAHHANGIAEAGVKRVCYSARTLLLHAKRCWPTVIKSALWPFALKAAAERHNLIELNATLQSPLELFCSVTDALSLSAHHTWGCPVFILADQNHSGLGTPKWEPRSRCGIYLGHSPHHAGNVALVLNLRTGHVSPQFHVVFDDEFSTVPYLTTGQEPPNWINLNNTSSELATPENFHLAKDWCEQPTHTPTSSSSDQRESVSIQVPTHSAPPHSNDLSMSLDPPPSEEVPDPTPDHQREQDSPAPSFMDVDSIGLRRSTRAKRPVSRLTYGFISLALLSLQSVTPTISSCYRSTTVAYNDFLDWNFDGTPNSNNPIAQIFSAISTKPASDNETYTMKEMLQQPDREHFEAAMKKEVQAMFDNKIWEIVPRHQMNSYFDILSRTVPTLKRKQIMTIWSFKRKRHPDGSLSKYKARLCCHGGQQQWGVNYWETYAPVISWMAVRSMLTLSKIHNLHTKSIDFVLAYPQADVKTPIFLYTPQGVLLAQGRSNVVLKLKKNLYGLKDAGRTWWEHLSAGLEDMGFTQSAVDNCLWTKGTTTIIIYVDDCIIFDSHPNGVDLIYDYLRNRYNITDEGSTISEFLGIQLTHSQEGPQQCITMSQPLLINRIIDAIPGMRKANPRKCPAPSTTTLTKDDHGPNRKESWNYRSVIGMLNFLVNSTRPELAFSVHQCARFCSNPKHSHEQAVKNIIRYLIGTCTHSLEKGHSTNCKGLIYNPDPTKGIVVHVDASFASEWNNDTAEEPSSVLSRTGYVISYCGCPILWASKLQSEIVLSTTEAEYVALSQSMRDVTPLIQLLDELRITIPTSSATPKVICTIFEDNHACIEISKSPRMRPRTKHIALKYHHFRSFVQDKTVSIQYVETSLQIADIFTKPLDEPLFKHLRRKTNGW